MSHHIEEGQKGKEGAGPLVKKGAGRDGFEGRDSKLFWDFVGVFDKLARIIEQRAGMKLATGTGAWAAAGVGTGAAVAGMKAGVGAGSGAKVEEVAAAEAPGVAGAAGAGSAWGNSDCPIELE